MSHPVSSSASPLAPIGLIGLVLLLTLPCGTDQERPGDSPVPAAVDGPIQNRRPLASNIDAMNEEFAQTVLGEGCGHEGCMVYIANPLNANPEIIDPNTERWPFVRLRTPKGDDLSFKLYEGSFFEALMNLKCWQDTSSCVVAINQVGHGHFSLVFYDRPRGMHTAYVNPSDLRFTVPVESLPGEGP